MSLDLFSFLLFIFPVYTLFHWIFSIHSPKIYHFHSLQKHRPYLNLPILQLSLLYIQFFIYFYLLALLSFNSPTLCGVGQDNLGSAAQNHFYDFSFPYVTQTKKSPLKKNDDIVSTLHAPYFTGWTNYQGNKTTLCLENFYKYFIKKQCACSDSLLFYPNA